MLDNYLINLLTTRKERLERQIEGKYETIRIYTQEINDAQKYINANEKEIEKINSILEDINESVSEISRD